MIRLDCQRPGITCKCIVETLQIPQGVAAVVECLNIVGFERQRTVIAVEGVSKPLQLMQNVAATIELIGVRLNFQGTIVTGNCVIKPPQLLKCKAEIGVECSIARLELYRP